MSIKAIKNISQVRGGSQARIMLADDGKKYVVKFMGLCGAPHKFCNVENSVMWSYSAVSHLCGVSRQAVSTLLRGLIDLPTIEERTGFDARQSCGDKRPVSPWQSHDASFRDQWWRTDSLCSDWNVPTTG